MRITFLDPNKGIYSRNPFPAIWCFQAGVTHASLLPESSASQFCCPCTLVHPPTQRKRWTGRDFSVHPLSIKVRKRGALIPNSFYFPAARCASSLPHAAPMLNEQEQSMLRAEHAGFPTCLAIFKTRVVRRNMRTRIQGTGGERGLQEAHCKHRVNGNMQPGAVWFPFLPPVGGRRGPQLAQSYCLAHSKPEEEWHANENSSR